MYIIFLFFFFVIGNVSAFSEDTDYVLQQKQTGVSKETVIQGNYTSIGDTNIEGVVEGSAYLIGTQASISGEIKGDLIVLGGSVHLSGVVHGKVEIFAGEAILEGLIGKGVVFIGGNIILPSGGRIGGNLFSVSGNLSLSNEVDGNVMAAASSFVLSGIVKKNVATFVNRLRIEGKIVGDLRYRSSNKVMITPTGKVDGTIIHKNTVIGDLESLRFFKGVSIGEGVMNLLIRFVYTFIIGCILISFFPKKLKRTEDALEKHPGVSFFYGFIVLLTLPIITAILLITVIGAPFAMTLFALNIISFYTMTVFPILWMSNAIFRKIGWKDNSIFGLLFGQMIYYFLTTIPLVGMIVACVATIFGFGATVVAQKRA